MSQTCGSVQAKIGPSILNANLADLSEECVKLLDAGADYLHLDVMDGHFVPNLTFGHPLVKCLRKKLGEKPLFDMHMMVLNPERWIEPMADAGANLYTFHYEATDNPANCIRKVKEAGMKVGLGLKPCTPVDVVYPYIADLDMVLIMTVEPGFGGQKFMHEMMSKVKALRSKYAELDIEVDGGVGPNTIETCADAGANMIVSGTAVINSPNPKETITLLRDKVVKSFSN